MNILPFVYADIEEGEMYYTASASESWYRLPRNGGIAYAPQESWVLNETIRVRLLVSYARYTY